MTSADPGAGGRYEPVVDTLTILTALGGKKLTKTHTWGPHGWETQNYDDAALFRVGIAYASSAWDLCQILLGVEHFPNVAIIRGRLLPTADPNRTYRLLHTRPDRTATFEPAERRWLLIDLDGPPAPTWLDPRDPVSLAWAVRSTVDTRLPGCFRDAAVAYQWSASAGVKPWNELRLHLWFWVDRFVCDASLKQWLKSIPGVDHSLANAVQLHFCAAPVYTNAVDPLAGMRTGYLDGRPKVSLPPQVVDGWTFAAGRAQLEAERQRHREIARARARVLGAGHGRTRVPPSPRDVARGRARLLHVPPAEQARAEGALRHARAKLRAACVAGNERHPTALGLARWLFRLVEEGVLTGEQVRHTLSIEWREGMPLERHDEITSLLAWAELHPYVPNDANHGGHDDWLV